ncbi:SDR family oxidoreductase [Mesorhizobium sp. NZP2298]|uniref:SDR family oxidoreductase n=1 Tax=Mesorhizobium sp. NZP2298 TaxID=2483403 RepID=UPI0015560B8C|nr:SDR family oxidoreductase [Mesorhizobium sp. NZP2298]QKC98353.1 SDR family oxidoreductase [Mesorhizobium sp. NZP2298]
MKDSVVVITGATSGIGAVAAMRLAERGARIIFVARDPIRGTETLEKLHRLAPNLEHRMFIADLGSVADTRRVAADIAAAESRIDILINNAGTMLDRRIITPEGLELTFALNHMAYFVLTEGLLHRLVASAPSRIVNTASSVHKGAKLNFADLQGLESPDALSAYGRSKLCNILFTRELARRLAGTGVTANCLHPGFVATRIAANMGGIVRLINPIVSLFATSPEGGAETIIYLASSPEVEGVTGQYFYRCSPMAPSAGAQDDAVAARLWEESERLASQIPRQSA